jgi:hypothetical protein
MALSFIKEPCCENFCLSCGGSNIEIPRYFSNLNLYIKPIINDISSTNPDNTKYTWNSVTGFYEPIWEWRGFIRTFTANGNTFPVRLIQSSPQVMGLTWFLQVRNWTNPSNTISQQNDYGIIAYYENTLQNPNLFPSGNLTLNDGNSQTYNPQLNNLSSLIAADERFPITISSGYCEFIYPEL